MATKEEFLVLLQPLLDTLAGMRVDDPGAAAALNQKFPLEGPVVQAIARMFRQGVQEGWLCHKAAGDVMFSRVAKDAQGFSVDAVHMGGVGADHLHHHGEFDLCIPVVGTPVFDGHPPGWTVYGGNTWHVPTVQHGRMDILYFLPGGAMTFGPQPQGSTAVGLQAGSTPSR